ncbi:MAG: guanine deaminase [Deltaproteobacteria bacterium RIFCSPLOWO2_02_FULL_47_10]|nr:MAG: guanine deaminase [Deltaproteobacteria bacterium RIFCSPLOWO2_02_FULL_47_10]
MTAIFRGRIIHSLYPNKIEEFKDGALVLDSHGRILACDEYGKIARGQIPPVPPFLKGGGGGIKIVDRRGSVIIPGLIDCHLHLPQLDQRGRHGVTLLDWLEKYIFPAEKAFENLRTAEDVSKRFFKKLILNGTTTAAIYATIHAKAADLAFRVAKDAGIRAIIGKVMMDQYAPKGLEEDTHQSLKDSEALCAKWHNAGKGRLMYAFTPRFAPTCSETLLAEVGNLARESGAYIQTHIAETVAENERVKELFPDYKDYTEVYEENFCLGPKTILGHAIHLSEDEMRRIAKSKTKLAHCPTSNFFLKSGRMPVELIEEHGITYGLGTDVGAGTSMSLLTAMRHADYIQPHLTVTPAKAFYLATLGGARALSLENSVGNFRKGKFADFCTVDIKAIDPRYKPSELMADEILSLLMYRGNGSVIAETYVGGEKLDVDGLKIKGEKNAGK